MKRVFRYTGIAGTIACLIIFIHTPSFPTPDKIVIFLTFIFMSFGKAEEMLKRLLPFAALLLVYESFRSIADHLNHHVSFTFMANFDRWLFNVLPTAQLQEWLWHGYVRWFDYVFYLPYILHFVMPIGLALLVWKYHDKDYWRYVSTYVILSFAGFLTYLLYPAAPPWMAAERGFIEPITRVSSHVWYNLGIKDFPSFYNQLSPNPVAAVPSLHAAYAILFSMFVFKFFGKKWGSLSLVFPVLLCFGIVYQGEHYVFDVILGALYAVGAYYFTAWLFKSKSARSFIKKLPGQNRSFPNKLRNQQKS